jgi:DNA repair exonuclease SbcCD nuclease subunit
MKIVHLSDVQIRTHKRHDEFKKHFDNLYASLKEQKPDAIVLTGDVVHQKSNISAELVDILVDFFRNMSEIAPLYVIAGNHDLVLNNLSRMDSLSPVVKALDSPNIFYYKHSGVFSINNDFNFVVFSCVDDESRWPQKEHIDNFKINVGLFHGMLQGAILQNGEAVKESQTPYKLNNFLDKVDYLLLGDIHKHQILDLKYKAAYPGSLIQQNYGESTEKGYLVWNIRSKDDHDIDFIKLPNVCPFYTIRLDESLIIPENLDFQKQARIRVFSRQLSVVEKQEISEKINSLFAPIELVFLDDLSVTKKQIILDYSHSVEDVSDILVQEKLLKKFFENSASESLLQKIFEINKKLNINQEKSIRNIQYKLGSLKFSNMFSYGENNHFDFSKYKGTVGIFGKNAVGKSSLAVDIPLYCLFNKVSKKGVVKNDLLINENSDACVASIEILVGNELYKVSRSTMVYSKTGKRQGTPVLQGKTDVDFRVIKDNIERELNGEERSVTDEQIRSIFGTAEDFMLTSMSPQWQLMGFLDAGATERQKILGRYFDIDIFDQKHKLAKEELKSLKSHIKLYENKDMDLLIKQCEDNIEALENEKSKLLIEEDRLRELSQKYLKQAENLDSNIVLQKFDDSKLFESKTRLKVLISSIEKNKSEILSFDRYECIKNENCCLKDRQAKVQQDLDKNVLSRESLERNIQKLEDEKNKIDIENDLRRQKFKEKSSTLKNESVDISQKANNARNMLLKVTADLGYAHSKLKNLQEEKDLYESLKENFDAYSKYTDAMSKDGISKSIIINNLDIINQEIKKILSKGVNFSIELESEEDGKAIEIYFKHERNKKRKIELSSGMEKCLAALAIRAALLSVTSLPKANVFILDEIFSSLDPEYIDAIGNILNYLKHLFDSIYIITHIETMKDLVDHSIQIERNTEGFSVIS